MLLKLLMLIHYLKINQIFFYNLILLILFITYYLYFLNEQFNQLILLHICNF